MSNRQNVATIELAAHGTFQTTLDDVARLERTPKRVLARYIAEAYGGGCGNASTVSYWLRQPKTVLVIVFGGLAAPTN